MEIIIKIIENIKNHLYLIETWAKKLFKKIEKMLYIDLRHGRAVKIENAPV